MKSLLKFAVLLLVPGAALAVYLMDYDRFGPTRETFVDIPSGTGTTAIAARLQSAGVLRSRYVFQLLRKVQGGTLKAGEYRFDHPLTPLEIYAHIARGDVYTIALTIPEGFNIFDIAQAAERAGLGTAPPFLAAERADTNLIADLRPHAPSLEGFLFPDTYRFSRHATPAQMLAAMVKRFRQAAAQLDLPPGPDLPRTITLASLIEKEVAVPAERPLVAGVFTNRLTLGMPLATDPSVIYAALLENRWRGTIYASDLANPLPLEHVPPPRPPSRPHRQPRPRRPPGRHAPRPHPLPLLRGRRPGPQPLLRLARRARRPGPGLPPGRKTRLGPPKVNNPRTLSPPPLIQPAKMNSEESVRPKQRADFLLRVATLR